jgi:hypothetical protein
MSVAVVQWIDTARRCAIGVLIAGCTAFEIVQSAEQFPTTPVREELSIGKCMATLILGSWNNDYLIPCQLSSIDESKIVAIRERWGRGKYSSVALGKVNQLTIKDLVPYAGSWRAED